MGRSTRSLGRDAQLAGLGFSQRRPGAGEFELNPLTHKSRSLTLLGQPSLISIALGSPEALITGAAVTSLALSTLHHLHRDQSAHSQLLIVFVTAGFIMAHFAGLTTTSALLCVVPWFGIAAFAITILISRGRNHIG